MPIKDGLIAAALVHGLTVVTRNRIDFENASVGIIIAHGFPTRQGIVFLSKADISIARPRPHLRAFDQAQREDQAAARGAGEIRRGASRRTPQAAIAAGNPGFPRRQLDVRRRIVPRWSGHYDFRALKTPHAESLSRT